MTHGNLAELARALETAKGALVGRYVGAYGTRLAFALADPMTDDERARLIGTIEGCWAAFVHHLFVQLGTDETPDSILALEERAREVAQEAYREAYRRAMEGAANVGA
jgi:hypothetical protein